MFELARLNDLIELKAKYLDKLYPEEHQWGLKQFGTLFCYDQLKEESGRFLEIGAGQNRFFDEHLPATIDYWAIDSAGFYDAAKYAHSASLRKRTTLHDGMMGDFNPNLPSGSFDAIFSISVLEHVPLDRISDVCEDMHRCLRPGGRIVHTLDLPPRLFETAGRAFLDSLSTAGFEFDVAPAVDYNNAAHNGALVEPASIVFKYYYGSRPEPWKNPPNIPQHTCTVKISAKKR